jgi:Uncharacterized protein conserved in bacteria
MTTIPQVAPAPMLVSASDIRARLGRCFRKQQEFSAGYAPLYSRLFGLTADWLAAEPGEDPLADWLARAGSDRSPFDVPLLLLAGLHRDILAGQTETADLARYYPTAGGTLPADATGLAACFRAAVKARRERLAGFIARAQVQTNETTRGLCWLLPTCLFGRQSFHLVDLGASAGLNLAADHLHFRIIDEEDRAIELGNGAGLQCEVRSEGAPLESLCPIAPTIRSRWGCDLVPLPLSRPDTEEILAAFIWGDQPERLCRLRVGIAALRAVNRSASPVRLVQADLTVGLPRFLTEQLGRLPDAPIVFCNTYLTAYLADKGVALRSAVAAWAADHPQPVLRLQWEPLRDRGKPPAIGWIGWTADLWAGGRHRQWHLAWVHPHGGRIRWTRELADWFAFLRNNPLGF